MPRVSICTIYAAQSINKRDILLHSQQCVICVTCLLALPTANKACHIEVRGPPAKLFLIRYHHSLGPATTTFINYAAFIPTFTTKHRHFYCTFQTRLL